MTADRFKALSGPQALGLYVAALEKANLSQAEMTFFMEAIASDSTALLPLLRNNGQLMRELGDEAENMGRSEEHTSELQSRLHLVCRLLLEKKN